MRRVRQELWLTRHLQTRWSKKPFKCPQYGKGFLESATLVRHQRTHTGEKPYACGDCRRRFSESSTLLRHHRSHQGARPHACATCGKGFRQRSYLVVHERIHICEGPFPCPEGGRRFSDCWASPSTGARTQVRSLIAANCVASASRVYPTSMCKPKCPECGKAFSVGSKLALHCKTHLGERPAQCAECGKCFSHSRLLSQHQPAHTSALAASATQATAAAAFIFTGQTGQENQGLLVSQLTEPC